MSGSRLVVLGGGPKAVALSAKAAVMRDLGHAVPEIIVVEPAEVASSWTPAGGMTSGDQILGTSPEKDVGFPYQSMRSWADCGASDAEMYRRFSWGSYLIRHGTYQEWIDRGKPNPRHSDWAAYLRWVAGESEMHIIRGAVTKIEPGTGWDVEVELKGGNSLELGGNGLVITGYGTVDPGTSSSGAAGDTASGPFDRFLDVAGFWHFTSEKMLPRSGRAIVVGAGEAAAAIIEHLLRESDYEVTVVSPGYMLYSRGESFYENEVYSNPERWREFPLRARREFINRTDRGVFSQRVLATLAALGRVDIIGGRMVDARECDSRVEITVERDLEKVQYRADIVIEATGRDAAWFLRVMSDSVIGALMDAVGGRVSAAALGEAVEYDLGIRGLTPRLHLPNLAGLMQGPGFPGMSCLGLMADRILRSYVR
jgi:mycobactin lysine-N-oxygenase